MAEEVTHIHYWILPPPNGPTIIARCRDCEATQEMPNTWEECLKRMGIKPDRADMVGHLNYLREQRLKQPKPY